MLNEWKSKDSFLPFADEVVRALRAIGKQEELSALVDGIAGCMGFRHYALIHHDDLRVEKPGLVDFRKYPPLVTERLVGQCRYRRDPIIRGCIFADSAFLWSELSKIIVLDRCDHDCFELGAREGLNEGITVPYVHLGDCMGSCTFAGTIAPESAPRYLGIVQMVGIFAFQAARRLMGHPSPVPIAPRLHPRPRDCVMLAGRGLSNKQIARQLALTPRTVDGYLTEARRLFNAHDRTELVVSAVLAGEVGLDELKRRQPE